MTGRPVWDKYLDNSIYWNIFEKYICLSKYSLIFSKANIFRYSFVIYLYWQIYSNSSCHPSQTKKAIPFGLSMIIIRICRDPEMRKQLMDRGYPNLLDSAIERAWQIPIKVALRCVNRAKKTKGPIFAHTYDPRLPPMAQIQARHWRTMVHILQRCLPNHHQVW